MNIMIYRFCLEIISEEEEPEYLPSVNSQTQERNKTEDYISKETTLVNDRKCYNECECVVTGLTVIPHVVFLFIYYQFCYF